MQREMTFLLESQKLKVEKDERKDFSVVKFKLGNNNIICLQSGIGEIYASCATQTLISEYKADIIVNFGVCGTLTDKIKTGECVLVDGVVHYDFDLSPIDDVMVGQYPEYSSPITPTDASLKEIVIKIKPDIKKVICASADKFVEDKDKKISLVRDFGADICEMESAGVVLACNNAKVPVLVIKAVSDGEGGAEEYKNTVDKATRSYVDLILKLSEVL